MSDLIQTKDLEQQFYSRPFYLSYSGLNKLLYSPSLFYRHYVLQQREEKLDSYLIDGKVIHCLLLDNGSFDEHFMLMPSNLPTGNTRNVVDKIYEIHDTSPEDLRVKTSLEEYSQDILDNLKAINLHQSLTDDKKAPFRTGDEKRLEKIITEDAKAYFQFLMIKGNKDLIDDVTLARCNEAVTAVRENKEACELLGLFVDEMDNVEIHNEQFLTAETDKSFGLKGILDNIKVDYKHKTIFINDLKTTGKTITEFRETLEVFNYWAQAAIYERLVSYNHADLLGSGEWQIIFNFIVIDKYNQVYCFEVSTTTMLEWQLRLEKNLNEAQWHYDKRDYRLPYEFIAGRVIL